MNVLKNKKTTYMMFSPREVQLVWLNGWKVQTAVTFPPVIKTFSAAHRVLMNILDLITLNLKTSFMAAD